MNNLVIDMSIDDLNNMSSDECVQDCEDECCSRVNDNLNMFLTRLSDVQSES